MLSTQIISEVYFNKEDSAWVKDEVARLLSEIPKVKSIVENKFTQHRSTGFITLKFHL